MIPNNCKHENIWQLATFKCSYIFFFCVFLLEPAQTSQYLQLTQASGVSCKLAMRLRMGKTSDIALTGRLCKFQKIYFFRPAWLHKIQRDFYSIWLQMVRFWTLTMRSVVSMISTFVYSFLPHGYIFTEWPPGLDIIVLSQNLYSFFCGFYKL